MAISLEMETEKYVDLPLSNFPLEEDNFERMSDVNSAVWPLVNQFNEYAEAQNFEACNNLIKNNPYLLKCLWTADKINGPRDAIIALERFFLNNVEPFYNTVAQSAVGINDAPTPEQESLVAYSAEKVNSIESGLNASIDKNNNIRLVTLPASGWTGDTAPYSQTISVDTITAEDSLMMVKHTTGAENLTLYIKQFPFIDMDGATGDGTATFNCSKKKPTIDLVVGLKGVI